jgi:putative DNA primase/helicase
MSTSTKATYTAAASPKRLHKAKPPTNPAAIPAELRALHRWVVWDYIDYRDGKKPRKVPVTPGKNHGLNWNVSTTWRSFEEVIREATDRGGLGIGFVFDEGDGFNAVDLDDAFTDDNQLKPWAQKIASRYSHTYGERTPSGGGLHSIGYGPRVVGDKRREIVPHADAVERYSENRWFTFTGDVIHDKPVIDVREAMEWLADTYFGGAAHASNTPAAVVPSDDPEFDIALARVCVEHLRDQRAFNSEDWRRVGYALKATSESLFPVWLDFSRRWSECSEEECKDRWNRFRPSSSVGTLVQMAVDDSGLTAINLRDAARQRLGREPWKPASGNGKQSIKAATGDKGGDADGNQRPQRRLVLVRASDIECSEINWLWPQRIVGDGLTIITGPVGISKSLISVDVAARVTTAGKWPDATGHAPQGSVILFGAEDDAGKVVVPRLMAAGADLSRVHVCQGTVDDDDGTDDGDQSPEVAAMILERHIGELRAALDDVADCRLIVFDPLPDYIAADENKSAEVRAALVPLARLAQERNVAVVAVAHQNKKNDLTTVQRIAGSSAFAQIARVVLSIGTHPEDADKQAGKRRVMLVSKNNYGETNVGQAYAIETRASGQPGLVWQAGTLTMDADEIARRPTGGSVHEGRRGEAVDALRDLLQTGEQSAAAITARLQDTGLGRRQIDHAAGVLNVIKIKHRDGWYWRLPARRAMDDAPQPEPAFAAWAPDEIDRFNST